MYSDVYIVNFCLWIENIKTDTFEKDNFFMNSLLNNKDLCNESLHLYEIYSSPLLEQYNIR